MITERSKGRTGRKQRGSSITEFGPAVGLLLICFLFPLIDLLSMGVSYGCCMVLNNIQVHEASLTDWHKQPSADTAIKTNVMQQWKNSGFGHFVKMSGDPVTLIGWRNGVKDENGIQDKIVAVKTTVTCNPFLSIPVPVVNVPGLNGPMTFTISSEHPMENPDYGL